MIIIIKMRFIIIITNIKKIKIVIRMMITTIITTTMIGIIAIVERITIKNEKKGDKSEE